MNLHFNYWGRFHMWTVSIVLLYCTVCFLALWPTECFCLIRFNLNFLFDLNTRALGWTREALLGSYFSTQNRRRCSNIQTAGLDNWCPRTYRTFKIYRARNFLLHMHALSGPAPVLYRKFEAWSVCCFANLFPERFLGDSWQPGCCLYNTQCRFPSRRGLQ